jgi:DnaJ family protein C protein 2
LQAPGFNPRACEVMSLFQAFCFSNGATCNRYPPDYFELCIPAFEDLCMFFDGKQDASKFICADPDAPFESVRKMYEFWAKFKSWRQFPAKDEHDLETADDRAHKRWMENENKGKRVEEKKKDTKLIKQFIEAAEANDPRVLAKRAEEKDQREAKRLAKGAGKREQEEAAAKAAAEAAVTAAATAEADKANKANAKKELEKQKKALRKEKARLREISTKAEGSAGHPGEDDVEKLCNALEFAALKALADKLTDKDGPGVVEGLVQALAGI